MNYKRGAIRTLPLVGLCLVVSACSTYKVWRNEAVRIDKDVYPLNARGEVELTEEQLTALQAEGRVVRVKHVAPDNALILDPEEMSILLQDRGLFYAALDNVNPDGEVSVLVKKGSLRENIERFINQQDSWAGLAWNLDLDYYVSKPFAVVGPDAQSVIMDVVSGYPIFVRFDQDAMLVKVYAASQQK